MRPVVGLVILGVLLGRVDSARAQPSEGERLFKEGVTLLEQAEQSKDPATYAEACDRFARSYASEERLNPLLHLARCEQGRGKLRTALKAWRAAAELAKRESDAPAQVMAEEAAKSVEAMLPSLIVRLPDSARSAVLEIDGEPAREGQPFAVDPGTHKVRATLGEWTEAKDVVVERGRTEIKLLEGTPPVKPVAPPRVAPPKVDGVDYALPGWVFLGVAGAAWIGTIATSAAYVGNCDEPFGCTENDFGGGLAEANLALWIGAPILTGVGVTLLIVEATDEDTASGERSTVAIQALPGGLAVRGSF